MSIDWEAHDKWCNVGAYAIFLTKEATACHSRDSVKSRGLLNDAHAYAAQSTDSSRITVARAWIDLFDDREQATQCLISHDDNPATGGFTWAENLRRLHRVFGDERLDWIRRELPQLESKYPGHLLTWAHEWGIFGAGCRSDMIRCIHRAEGTRGELYVSKCIEFATVLSEVPTPCPHKRVRSWLRQAEKLAYGQDKFCQTYDLLACAWAWRSIYPDAPAARHMELLRDAESAASTSNDYFLLAEYVSYGDDRVASTRQQVGAFILIAESLAHTKQDRETCACIRYLFGEKESGASRYWRTESETGS